MVNSDLVFKNELSYLLELVHEVNGCTSLLCELYTELVILHLKDFSLHLQSIVWVSDFSLVVFFISIKLNLFILFMCFTVVLDYL